MSFIITKDQTDLINLNIYIPARIKFNSIRQPIILGEYIFNERPSTNQVLKFDIGHAAGP